MDRHEILRHASFVIANPDPVPHLVRLVGLQGEASDGVAKRVLEREAKDDGARGRGQLQSVIEEEDDDRDEEGDGDRVLEDGREVIGKPILTERIHRQQHDQVAGRQDQQHRRNGPEGAGDPWRRAGPDGEPVRDQIADGQRHRQHQLALHVGVAGTGPCHEGTDQHQHTDQDGDRQSVGLRQSAVGLRVPGIEHLASGVQALGVRR